MSQSERELQRTMSLTDLYTSSLIRDVVERDLTIPGDRTKHRFFFNLPKHDIVLPSLTRFDADFRKFFLSVLVDLALLKDLEAAKSINWCSSLRKFLPLITLADGNCLMNAASISMWAINDRRLTLRKTVYQVLIEDQTDIFKNRWQFEQEKHLEEQHGSAVDCSSEEWLRDWKNTIELASTKKSADTNCFTGLEEIHIFALSNVLRRPIIILCDDVFRGNYDESLANVNMGGIYLPLQSDSVDCIKSPLMIGYHHGHFTALVTTEDGSINVLDEEGISREKTKNAVPLVKSDGSPMTIHFLLPEEKQHSDRLLREYLDCSKVEYVGDGGTETTLVAIMKHQEPEAHLDPMFKTYFDAVQAVYLEELTEKMNMSSSNQPGKNVQFTAFMGGTTTDPHTISFAPRKTILPETELPTSGPPCCGKHKRCKTAGCTCYTTQAHGFCHQCKNEEQHCTSPGCSFMANPECQGLCSMCYTRYHAILDKQTATRPSAPPANPCRSKNCQKLGNQELHNYCVECYLVSLQEPIGEVVAGPPGKWTTGESQHPSQPGMVASHEVASVPNEETFGRKVASATASPVHKFSRQVSLFCLNENCLNHLRDSASGYCNDCMESMPAQMSSNSTVKTCKYPACGAVIHPGNSSDVCSRCMNGLQSSVISSGSSTFEMCRVPGCTMPAVTYHGELCLEHYQQSQRFHQANSCEHSSHHHAFKKSEATKCINTGCKFFGNPENNYLCSSCHSKALQELYEVEKTKEEEEKAKAKWFARNYGKTPAYPGHQSSQFDNMAHTPRIAFYMQNTSTARSSNSAPPSPNARKKWTNKGSPCATQGCPCFGTPEKKGFCDFCFKKQETVYHGLTSGRSRFCSTP